MFTFEHSLLIIYLQARGEFNKNEVARDINSRERVMYEQVSYFSGWEVTCTVFKNNSSASPLAVFQTSPSDCLPLDSKRLVTLSYLSPYGDCPQVC